MLVSSYLLYFTDQRLSPGLWGSAPQPSGQLLGSQILPPMEQPSFESRSGGRCQGQSDQVWCQAAAGSSSAAPGAQLSLQRRLRQLIVLRGVQVGLRYLQKIESWVQCTAGSL